jgi:hypothetical protein
MNVVDKIASLKTDTADAPIDPEEAKIIKVIANDNN